MAMQSMTGYGRGEVKTTMLSVAVELSAVNRKQLDVHLRLDRDIQVLEPQITTEINRRISRGRITGDVRIEWRTGSEGRGMRVDEALAADCVSRLRKAAAQLKLNDDLSASLLLSLPNVVTFKQNTPDAAACLPDVMKALDKALAALIAMRKREGAALADDLSNRLKLMERQVDGIERKAPQVAAKYREDLLRRIREAGVELDEREDRVVKEVALFADRSDISEEITRLRSHIAQTRKLFRAKEPCGRPLDFIAQEMFREINTIGSKANDAGIIREVLAFKTELERFREQVQNIE